MLPGLGRDWTDILAASQPQAFQFLYAYIAEWDAVVARWARDDHVLLQPRAPCWVVPVGFCITLMKGKIAKKELELCAVPTIHHYPVPFAIELSRPQLTVGVLTLFWRAQARRHW